MVWVNLSPCRLLTQGVEYNVGTFPMSANSRAKCNMDDAGVIKVLGCKKTDRMLGVYMVASVRPASPAHLPAAVRM